MTEPDRGDRLLSTAARLSRWATRRADLELPPAQARLLALVLEIGPARIGDLAQADHCSQPTMTIQVQRVEAYGLVVRKPDPSDARASLVEATDEGRQVIARLREARSKALAPMMDRLSPDDERVLDEAIAIMQRMIDDP
ncbi:MarR family winged helix-turn-helix transcriptional regulator [Demetria terragena]|uniref:MarR family winged helix-turn-helix transcriptional regulator n=1 Tax=Demetria terragena TaxID=63959 RepID=UPI000364E76D|nr:MarR family transcriptional regulator [Demetria terragena]